MKNARIEKFMAIAKREANERREGLYIPHCYSESRDYSWWDDCSFRLGKQRISVCWIHPRMDHVESTSYDEAVKKYPNRDTPFLGGEKIYKKVGKSRKKVAFYSSGVPTEETESFYDYWRELRKSMVLTSDYVVKPYIKAVQWKYARGVMVCLPIEVKSRDDVKVLARLIETHLRGTCDVVEMWSQYTYTKEDWIKEGHVTL